MAFDTESFSVNQRLPSCPATIWFAEPEFEGIGNSVTVARSARSSRPSTCTRGLQRTSLPAILSADFHRLHWVRRRTIGGRLMDDDSAFVKTIQARDRIFLAFRSLSLALSRLGVSDRAFRCNERAARRDRK